MAKNRGPTERIARIGDYDAAVIIKGVLVPSKHFSLTLLDPDRVLRALTKGVDEALLQHKLAGRPIAVWRDGKTVIIPPEMIEIPDRSQQNPG